MALLRGLWPVLALTLVPIAFAVGVSSPAAAHENRVVVEGLNELQPGGSVSFPVELHYHRLVGDVRVEGSAQVEVRVHPEGRAEEAILAGAGTRFTVNTLVACCKDATWSPYRVVATNVADEPVRVHLRLVVLHDGFAVIGEDAEPGALLSTLLPFVALSAFFAFRLIARRGALGDPGPWTRWAVAAHAAMWVTAGTMGLLGMVRYGAGPVSGAIAAAADLPWLRNPIVTTQDLVLGAGIVLWAISVGAWAAAARRAEGSTVVGWTGVALGAGAALACLLWAVEYGYILAPAAIAVAAAALPAGAGLWVLVGPSRAAAGRRSG